MSSRRLPPALIAITPGDLRAERVPRLVAAVRAAWAAGLRGVLVREAELSDRAYLELARGLREVIEPADGGWMGVHDRAHLADELGADAVHCGFRSLRPRKLREWLEPSIAIGLSTHAGDDVREWEGADYLFHGPMFATAKKAHALEPIGVEGVRRAVEMNTVPLWALGGLRPEHARAVSETGARGMAVLSGILGDADPAQRAREYLAAWNAATMRP